MTDLLSGHRQTQFTYELLGKDLSLIGPLQGVQPGGSLDWSQDRSVKGGGSLVLSDVGQQIVWASARIRIGMTVNGQTWPLGVWVPAIPGEDWTGTGRTWQVSLLDMAKLLDVAALRTSYTVGAGEVVTDRIRSLIEGAGLTSAVTDSPQTKALASVWDPGTTRLQILSDLCDASNYLSVYADGWGAIHADPYIPPSQRPVVYEFVDGANCIYTPEWGRTQDWDDVPTEVVLTTEGDDTTPGLIAYYKGPDSSPASEAARGYAVTYVEQVDATDQPTLDALAQRRWLDKSTPQGTVTIRHMPVQLAVNDAVRFCSSRAGLDGTYVVQSTRLTLAGTELAETALTEVTT